MSAGGGGGHGALHNLHNRLLNHFNEQGMAGNIVSCRAIQYNNVAKLVIERKTLLKTKAVGIWHL